MPARRVSGPPPKENRRRRNADVYAGHEVTVTAGKVDAPPLPGRWPAAVKGWYETWRASPQAQTFTVTDWQRLHMLAPLVDQYFKMPDKALMAEIRLNESLLGATHADRLRSRIKVEKPTPEVPPGVPSLDEYRDRLTRPAG